MLDIGWSELLIIAVVAILVVGPKDLPRMLRQLGNYVGKIKRTANDFKSQFDEAIKDSELDDIKSSVDEIAGANPIEDIKSDIEESLDVDIYSDQEMEDIDLDVGEPSETASENSSNNKVTQKSGPDSNLDTTGENNSIENEPQNESEHAEDTRKDKPIAAENRGA